MINPFRKGRTYLDYAAAAPVSQAAGQAFLRALTSSGNPSSPHEEGRRAHDLLEDARMRVARLAGVKSDAVIFTSGATEANALGIEGHIRALLSGEAAPENIHALYLPGAHSSVTGAMKRISQLGVEIETMELVEGGLDLSRLKTQLRPTTRLVVLDLVCGETGTLHKVRDARRVLDAYAKETGSRALLLVDASQAPFVESFELSHLGADMITLDAQKVGGIRGVGALIADRRILLKSLVEGGGQERGLRPGTEPVALIFAFAEALEEANEKRIAFLERAGTMRASLIEKLKSAVSCMELNEGKLQVPHILNLSLRGRDTDYLVALLDEAGFAVSTKSACETDEKASRAVLALTGDEERAKATLRVSWGSETTERDLDQFASALIKAVRFVDDNAI